MPDTVDTNRQFVDQLRRASDEELRDRKRHITESLFNLRFRLASGQIEDPKRVRKYRKGIARINTILRERELEINQ